MLSAKKTSDYLAEKVRTYEALLKENTLSSEEQKPIEHSLETLRKEKSEMEVGMATLNAAGAHFDRDQNLIYRGKSYSVGEIQAYSRSYNSQDFSKTCEGLGGPLFDACIREHSKLQVSERTRIPLDVLAAATSVFALMEWRGPEAFEANQEPRRGWRFAPVGNEMYEMPDE